MTHSKTKTKTDSKASKVPDLSNSEGSEATTAQIAFTDSDLDRLDEILTFLTSLSELFNNVHYEGSVPVTALRGILSPLADSAFEYQEKIHRRFDALEKRS